MSNPASASWNEIKITINGDGGYLSGSSGNYIAGYTVNILDIDGSGTLTDGDEIHIHGESTLSGAVISLSIEGYTGSASVAIS